MLAAAGRSRTAPASVRVVPSLGMRTVAMSHLPGGRGPSRVEPPPDFEQELQDLDVTLGLGQVFAPGIEAVAADQDPVGARVSFESRLHLGGERVVVLGVLEYGNPLAMLVRPHPGESLEHLVAFDGEAAGGGVGVGKD